MKQFVVTLLLLLLPLTAFGQKEQDFASRFIALHGEGSSLSCVTVSPLMLERIMQLPDLDAEPDTRRVLSQLKSIRVVNHSDAAEGPALREKAEQLVRRNANRYKPYATQKDHELYVRRRGKKFVEMVLFAEQAGHFILIDLTGNMTDDFLRLVLKV